MTENTKRTRDLGELRWCRCDEREGWTQDVALPPMPDTASAKKALAAYLDQPENAADMGARFRLVRVVEEVTPTVVVKRTVKL